jgi:hypothetical protein
MVISGNFATIIFGLFRGLRRADPRFPAEDLPQLAAVQQYPSTPGYAERAVGFPAAQQDVRSRYIGCSGKRPDEPRIERGNQ